MEAVDLMVADAVEWVNGETTHPIRLVTTRGGGTTTALLRIGKSIRNTHLPIYVSGSPDVDGAVSAVAEIVDATADSLAIETIADLHETAEVKFTALRNALSSVENPVLLLDQPSRWLAWGDDGAAGDLSRRFREELGTTSVPVIIGGGFGAIGAKTLRYDSTFDSTTLFDDRAMPDVLRGAAKAIQEASVQPLNVSGAVVRLAILVASLTNDTGVLSKIRDSFRTGRVTVSQLTERITEIKRYPEDLRSGITFDAFEEAWKRCAVMRAPAPGLLVRELLDPIDCDEPWREALVWGLTAPRPDGKRQMHGSIRRAHRAGPIDAPVHADVARAWHQYAGQNGSALRAGVEAWFHKVRAGLHAEDVSAAPWFVEQLCLEGKLVSRKGFALFRAAGWHSTPEADECFQAAAGHFAEALEIEKDNPYALHYRGFNLDAIGDRSSLAFLQNAAAQDPENVWWRSRLITHLMARGRTDEAESAWGAAVDECVGAGDGFLTEHLHRWVMRHAIEYGNVEFAREIWNRIDLGDVEEDVAAQLDRMRERLERYELASRDRDVLPLAWDHRQLGVTPTMRAPEDITTWRNARVLALQLDPDVVVLATSPWFEVAAPRDPLTAEYPEITTSTLAWSELDEKLVPSGDSAADISVGSFLEFYDDGASARIVRVEPAGKLTPLFPEPTRYRDRL